MKKKRPGRLCFYCGELQKSLPRHLKRKHKDEDLVVKVFSASDLEEKKRILAEIRKMGTKSHNMNTIKQCAANGVLVTGLLRERNQGSAELVMCPNCSGFYSKGKIRQHTKYCFGIGEAGRVTPISLSSFVPSIFEIKTTADKMFKQKILDCFREDNLGMICRNDKVIILLGKCSYIKGKGRKKTMTDMRQLASLLLHFRLVSDHPEYTGENLLNKSEFNFLEMALDEVTLREDGNLKAGLRLSIGHLLKHVIRLITGQYIIEDNMAKAEEVELFKCVLDMRWDMLFAQSRYLVESRREVALRRPKQLPLEEDVLTLRNHNLSTMKKLIDDQYLLWDVHHFNNLRALIVCRLTLFNAHRGGEPCKLTLQQWREAEDDVWVNKHFVDKITDPVEKALLETYKIAYQGGKNNRLVPVLLPKDCIPAIQKLVSLRDDVGVQGHNVYLFANTQGSDTHVDGWQCVKKVCDQVELQNPKIIKADTFRHRASTIYELQDASEENRRAFYAHMGHSEDINKNIYQCPHGLREILTVGPFLRQMDEEESPEILNSKKRHRLELKEYKKISKPKKRAVIEESESDEQFDPAVSEESVSDEECEKGKKQYEPSVSEGEKENKTKSRGRRYFVWDESSANTVKHYFNSYINDCANEGTKGRLPGKKEIQQFMMEFQEVLPGLADAPNIIKTKIFNERTKRRNLIKAAKSKLSINS